MKWKIIENKYALRSITKKDLKLPEKPKLKCLGFTYNGAKLFDILLILTRETENPPYSDAWKCSTDKTFIMK